MPDEITRKLGERVTLHRESLNLNQLALARRAKVAPSTLCDLERGRINPTVETLARLAAALGVTIATLVQD